MTTYGNEARISVELTGGGITGISGGEEQKAVLFARGDPDSGGAEVNQPTQVFGADEAVEEFGADTEVVEYLNQLTGSEVPYNMIWTVMPEQVEVTEEDVTDGGAASDHTDGAKIAEGPIIENASLITFVDGNGDELDVVFRYETNTGSGSNDFSDLEPSESEVYINPNTREWSTSSEGDYNITYEYLDWQSAFTAAEDVVEEQEAGVWALGTESKSIVDSAQNTIEPLREEQWKMVTVFALGEPNRTGDDDAAEFAVGEWEPGVDSDETFLVGPSRLTGETLTPIGSVAGIAASNGLDDPIIGDELSEVDELEQTLNVPEQVTFSDNGGIPLSNNTTPAIEGNMSTSTDESWIRSYFARRLADYLILAARAIGRANRGELNNDNTEGIVEQQLTDEIITFIDDGVLEPNDDGEDNWYVEATQDPENPRELDLSFAFTPVGVVDTVDISGTINY